MRMSFYFINDYCIFELTYVHAILFIIVNAKFFSFP
jgi:hypothetical protein